jgi:hypothetical protein
VSLSACSTHATANHALLLPDLSAACRPPAPYPPQVKWQLWKATGVPIEEQKVMLAGIGELVMGDKR